ncbi:MAG: hypothetical protein KKA42_00890, partial [candidate division Zixibacteria bacterium]|nr:hypothetical protein [candidate division Zixibacteria bacterium]
KLICPHIQPASTPATFAVSLALFSWAFLYAMSTMIEAGWMWGQISFTSVFLIALIARSASHLPVPETVND